MSNSESSIPTLGLPFHGGLRNPGSSIHGANIAIMEALEMIVRHSEFPRIRIFVAPGQSNGPVEGWLGRIRPLARSGAEGLVVEKSATLPHRGLGRLDAWHSTTGRTTRGIHVRSVTGGRFPVTGVHHSFASNKELHDWVLRLLLDDVRPYDSQVAASRASQAATRRSIRHVQRALQRQLGTPLPFGGRVDRLPLGVDTQRFVPRDKAQVRYDLGLPIDELLVSSIGRISAAGKADLVPMIDAFASIVRRSERRVRLVLCGVDTEGYTDTLRAHARALGIVDRVWFQGTVPPAERHLWHAAADVFVSPADSMQETFGLTCIEAMACGVPQVVSDWNGYRDTVVEGVTGYRAPTTWIDADRDVGLMAAAGEWALDHFALAQSVVVDMDVFRERLSDLIEDADLRRRMGEASRARAVEHYEWSHIVSRYDALWLELGAIARTTAHGRRRGGQYLISRYVDTFRGNATRMITKDSRIVLSERGHRVVEGEEGLPQYFTRGFTLDYGLIEDALVSLGRRGKSIGQIAASIASERSVHPDRVVRHVVWLLKYDLARLVGSAKSKSKPKPRYTLKPM